MQCYQDLTPPTAITASVSLPFVSASTTNLIVAKTSLIQIFALKSILVANTNARTLSLTNGTNDAKAVHRSHVSKLVLVGEYEVSGTITALAKAKSQRSKSGGDLLLVATKDAKLSLVEWDPEKHSISTVSIHYYEREDLQGAPWAPQLGNCSTILTVDPSSRCVALKFGPRSLAILPLKQAHDDLAMEDIEQDNNPLRRTSSRLNGDASEVSQISPYSASFVLSLLLLDPVLTHPIHLAFLYEYRDPTIGILSSKQATSCALLQERRDIVAYTVYTLDIEQQASTPLVSVTGLPYSMQKVMPLPLPIGGSLLIGNDCLVHVGQAGKTNAIAVNPLAQLSSDFPMIAHEDTNLRLEGCTVELLGSPNGELVIITANCEMAILSFKMDGRSVSGLDIRKIAGQQGFGLITTRASCATNVGNGRIFVGSCDGDSMLIGWTSKHARTRSHRKEILAEAEDGSVEDPDSDDEDDFEDDLYGNGESHNKSSTQHLIEGDIFEDIEFRKHDTLMNLAPLSHLTVEKSNLSDPLEENNSAWTKLDFVGVSGRGMQSSLVRISPTICPSVEKRFEIPGVVQLWAMHLEASSDDLAADSDEHNILIATMDPELSEGGSSAYRIHKDGITPLEASDFESEAGVTVEVGSLFGGLRIVQVLKHEVRAFDGDFSLAQIIPAAEDSEVVAASFADPFVLLTKNNGSITILRADDNAELEELEAGDAISRQKWRSGSFYDDIADTFRLIREVQDEDSPTSILLFLLSEDGGLSIFCMPNLARPVYTAPGLSFLPSYLTPEFTVKRSNATDTLVEILVASLGDQYHSTPYLILRSSSDDLTLYSPYHAVRENVAFNALQFRKISNSRVPHAPNHSETEANEPRDRSPLRILQDLDGHHAVCMPGHSPCLILKAASCGPKTIDLKLDQLSGLTKVNISGSKSSVLFPGRFGRLTMASLPMQSDFSTGWVTRKMYTTDPIQAFAYHEPSGRYVVGTNRKVPFKLPQDDFHPEWESEDTEFLPLLEVGGLELVDPATWTITDRFDIKEDEVIMSVEKMSLELSENTHARKSVVGVATAGIRGEDINAYGTIYVLDVIDVVPVPDQPETGRKFKTLAHHRDKGAVTAICQVGSEGFLLGTQGQKCMVRGVKDDASLLPVAFMDIQCYVTIAKELRGAGLCILGDAIKGLWLAGYTEDPYHLKMFGKSAHDLEVVNADFLPDGKALYIVISDADTNIHLLRFDPQNPKSLSGQHLLELSSFHTGFYCSTMTLLPRTTTSWEKLLVRQQADDMDIDNETVQNTQQLLITNQTGSISLITNIPDSHAMSAADAYRTLSALQTYLTSTLPQSLGLSPKAYRSVDVDMSVGGRAMLDGNVLKRWMELGSWKRAEGISRIGSSEWQIKALLEAISERSLGVF